MPCFTAHSSTPAHRYSDPLSALRSIYAHGGIPSLYLGWSAFMLQTAGKASIRFYTFSNVKTALHGLMGEEQVKSAGAGKKMAIDLTCVSIE